VLVQSVPSNLFQQSFSQGEGEDELDFRAYCEDVWDTVIEKKFMEWSMKMFGSECLRDAVGIAH